MYAKGGDETDIWSFRCLDSTETTVVRVVYVTHLKARTLTRETAWSECRYTTLISDLGQRVGLIQELRKLLSTEK